MNAITTAVTAAKSMIDRLLSNGNASATSGLIKGEQRDWTYTEQFSGPEISVDYRYNGKEWEYKVATDDLDSTFFSRTGTARTLREARLEALDAMTVGCAAQDEKTGNNVKEELLKLMLSEDHEGAVSDALDSGLLPGARLQGWLDRLIRRAVNPLLSFSSVPEWEAWASLWLSTEDQTEASSRAAAATASASMQCLATRAAAGVARAAACAAAMRAAEAANIVCAVATWTARWRYGDNPSVSIQTSQELSSMAEAAEREHQYRDLLAMINEM